MPYSGPIYFEAVPCSPLCCSCPSALASSSRLQASNHANTSLVETGEFEWTRVDSEAGLDSLIGRRSLNPSYPSHLNDVRGPLLASSRSFDFLPAPARTRALATWSDEAAEMTPVSHSRNSRSTKVPRPERIRERSLSSQVTLSSAALNASSRSEPFSHLLSYKRTGDHVNQSSIRSWVSGVDRGQQPLLDHSVPLRSDSLPVPRDVDLDPDLYSPRAIASSSAHLSAVTMSAPGSSYSSPLPGRGVPPLESASFASDRAAEGCSNGWHHMMDEAPSFLTSSPCPSSHSSTMGFASTLPREPSMLDETMYRSLLDRWSESDEWRGEEDEEGERSTSGLGSGYVIDAYPRSATSSSRHSDAEMHPAVLPALLDQQDFSTLMLQSFTLALADASLEENEGFQPFSAAAEAEIEDDKMSILSSPTHIQDFDFMDQWSPPALRSSSSASSLDPFHLELFSPASEQTDPAGVWDAPGDSSESPGYFSSSPFVGWSSASDTEMKSTSLTLGRMPMSAPFAEIPLYQPQPIRPIPPIDIPLNLLDELPEGNY